MALEEYGKEKKTEGGSINISFDDIKKVLTYKIPIWGVLMILFIIWWIFK